MVEIPTTVSSVINPCHEHRDHLIRVQPGHLPEKYLNWVQADVRTTCQPIQQSDPVSSREITNAEQTGAELEQDVPCDAAVARQVDTKQESDGSGTIRIHDSRYGKGNHRTDTRVWMLSQLLDQSQLVCRRRPRGGRAGSIRARNLKIEIYIFDGRELTRTRHCALGSHRRQAL